MSDHKPNYKLYYTIFGSLLVLTVVTVLVSYWHLPPVAAIGLGLAIATLKAGLVVAFFMHLKGERTLIWVFLGLTVFTIFGFLLMPLDQKLISDRTTHAHVGGEAHH